MRQAFLIIAHNQWWLVENLFRYLDSEDVDIYLHVNSLVEMPDIEKMKRKLRFSSLYIEDRKEIIWGKYGLMDVVYSFLEKASAKEYDYYHIMSGQDVPLKSMAQLKQFLSANIYINDSKNLMTNYINCHIPNGREEYFPVAQYNLFVAQWRNKNPLIRKLAKGTALLFNYFQSLLGINRFKNIDVILYKGDAFFSFSHEFVLYAITKREWVKEHFSKYSFAPEEYIFQTLMMNSKYKNTVLKVNNNIHSNLRHVDFERGTPYVWRKTDYSELLNTGDFFARKFDLAIDRDIVVDLYNHVLTNEAEIELYGG